MKTMRLLFFLLTGLLLWGCKAPRFAKHPDWSVLNGTYYAYAVNKDEPQQHYFDLLPRKYYNESPNTQRPTEFNLTLRGDSLFVSYKQLREWVLQDTTAVFKGKKKRKYWRHYFQFRIIPFYPIIAVSQIDKIRIGSDDNGDLLVKHFIENEGAILMVGAGYSYENVTIYQKKDKLPKGIIYPFIEGDHYGIINAEGTVVSPTYEYVSAFTNGFALMEQNNKWGTINEKGEVLIPPTYDALYSYSDEHAFLAKKNGLWGVLNEEGREVLPFIYEDIQWQHTGDKVFSTLFLVKKDNKWGILDKKGEVLLPLIYDEIRGTRKSCFVLKKDNKEGRYYQREGQHYDFIPAIFTRFCEETDYKNPFGEERAYRLAYSGDDPCFVDSKGYEYNAITTPLRTIDIIFLDQKRLGIGVRIKKMLYEPDLSTRRKIKD
jgi:KWG repeat domain protein